MSIERTLTRVSGFGKVAFSLTLAMFCAGMAFAQEKPIGVSVHPGGLAPEKQEAQLRLVQDVKLTSVRFDMPWKFIETQPGHYEIPRDLERYVDAAKQRGIEPVLILDYGNPLYDGGDKPRSQAAINAYVNYAQYVVRHFRGRVRQFEVWNEWDNHTGGFEAGSAEDYAALFRATYPAIKAANHDSIVLVGAGVRKGWEERLAGLGVIQMGDGLAVHPYNYQTADDLAPEHCARTLVELESRLRSLTGKANVDLYITEIGWPTNSGKFGVTEQAQRSFATRLALLMQAIPFVKGVWWYDLIDDGVDPLNKEHHFGLFRNTLAAKPAAAGIAAAAALSGSRSIRLSSNEGLNDGAVAIESRSFSGGPGEAIVWDVRQSGRIGIECVPGRGPRAVKREYGAASVGAAPTIVVERDGKCAARAVDPD
ncbi:cellulase family glycosylhydrolase [Paraburkholderia bannensis]|uniref:cellulase family glycosylhydrolase n=1 Tax=Paraburkholderia bannensis TaxID=765414 RepID=UPI002AC3566D|nr:cellulase family glycosylhydrolase [Paraburkholderia bannensis]